MYLNLRYDGPGSGMYRFLGRCNPQVARLWVNRLPSWIPQVGCCAPGSKCGHPPTSKGVLHMNNNGDIPGLLFLNK